MLFIFFYVFRPRTTLLYLELSLLFIKFTAPVLRLLLRFITPSPLNLQFYHCLGFDSAAPCIVVSVFVSANRRNVLSAKRMGLTVIGIQGSLVLISNLFSSTSSHFSPQYHIRLVYNSGINIFIDGRVVAD